jgi:hypothetical protein
MARKTSGDPEQDPRLVAHRARQMEDERLCRHGFPARRNGGCSRSCLRSQLEEANAVIAGLRDLINEDLAR